MGRRARFVRIASRGARAGSVGRLATRTRARGQRREAGIGRISLAETRWSEGAGERGRGRRRTTRGGCVRTVDVRRRGRRERGVCDGWDVRASTARSTRDATRRARERLTKERGARVRTQARDDMSLSTSPVLAAAASNDLAQVRWLLERENVPVDFMGDWYAEPRNGGKGLERQRRTPCMVAASHGSLEVLLYVLQMGADPNLRSEDEDRCTAMHCAAAGGAALSTDAIKTLLLFGADRNARDTYGRVPADCLPGTTSEVTMNGSDGGGSSSGGSGVSMGGNGRGHGQGSGAAVNSQGGMLQDPDPETLMSDEFRMYEFKIRRCSRTRAHDWTECPYTHPGEKARRRDPRRFNYSGTACPEFRKGSCPRGDVCEYAHGVFECWLHPSRYRTQLCKDGAACDRRACFFAHHTSQLRVPTDAFGNGLCGKVSPDTPSPTGSGSPQNGSPRQSSASLDWSVTRSSESDSTHSMAAAMLRANPLLGAGGAAAFDVGGAQGMAFPPLPMLQSQYSQQLQGLSQQGSSQIPQQSQSPPPQQVNQNAQMMANYVSSMANMQGMNGADIQGNMFSLGYNSMFNQPDASFQGQHQMMQQTAMMDGNAAAGGGMGPKAQSSGSGGSTVSDQKGLHPGAKLFTLPAHNLQTQHLRRNSSSFQHLGMIEGVLDGDELRQEK